jgi:class 3 adenylate cyclase
LCKKTGRDAVLSESVMSEIGERWPNLGRFELAGVARPVEVYALP